MSVSNFWFLSQPTPTPCITHRALKRRCCSKGRTAGYGLKPVLLVAQLGKVGKEISLDDLLDTLRPHILLKDDLFSRTRCLEPR